VVVAVLLLGVAGLVMISELKDEVKKLQRRVDIQNGIILTRTNPVRLHNKKKRS
jgi:hypothetical protein